MSVLAMINLRYCHFFDRIVWVKLKGKLFNIAIIVSYAPTAQEQEEIDNFYSSLDEVKAQWKWQELTIIVGSLNEKVR